MSDYSARKTVNHEEIRQWAESRGGHPSTVKSTERGGHAGILRLDFEANGREAALDQIAWDEFFAKFDEQKLAFLYQDHTKAGKESRFFRFIRRTGEETPDTPAKDSASHRGSQPLISALNDLLKMELHAYELCGRALETAPDGELKTHLESIAKRCEEDMIEVETFILGLGGEATALAQTH